MKLYLDNRGAALIELNKPIEISIPLDFDGDQPNHFGVARASARPLQAGGFIGEVSQGGGCNVQEIRLIPHCNGTHTESAGHITALPLPVDTVLRQNIFLARLMTVEPVRFGDCPDSYHPVADGNDLVITLEALQPALGVSEAPGDGGLIIRTTPNPDSKRQWDYSQQAPPYFTLEAMDYIADLPIRHLLVDLPSIDRTHDEGALLGHHRFWKIPDGQHALVVESRPERTITEMIFAPDRIADGLYFCQIQIPPFRSDAAPSRVFLYQVHEQESSG